MLQNKSIKNNTFNDAYNLSKNTPKGKEFQETLKSQDKKDIFYTSGQFSADGFTIYIYPEMSRSDVLNTSTRFKNMMYYKQGTDEFKEIFNTIKKVQEEDKELIIIGINEDNIDSCSDTDIIESAATIAHENNAHGFFKLLGELTNSKEEHEYYFGESTEQSPNTSDILTQKKYKNTPAYQDLISIIKQLTDNE